MLGAPISFPSTMIGTLSSLNSCISAILSGVLSKVDVKPTIGKSIDPKTHTLKISLGVQLIPDPALSDLICNIPNISSLSHHFIRDPRVAENFQSGPGVIGVHDVSFCLQLDYIKLRHGCQPLSYYKALTFLSLSLLILTVREVLIVLIESLLEGLDQLMHLIECTLFLVTRHLARLTFINSITEHANQLANSSGSVLEGAIRHVGIVAHLFISCMAIGLVYKMIIPQIGTDVNHRFVNFC